MAPPHLKKFAVALLSVFARPGRSQLVTTGILRSVCPASPHSFKAGMHVKARALVYPVRRDEKRHGGDVMRLPVPDDQVGWCAPWPEYAPPDFTAPFVLTAAWADPPLTDPAFRPVWNAMDGDVDRRSHDGLYATEDNRPLNPQGRTGLRGRGVLGRWGPNHAADPIVTRWQRDAAGGDIVHHAETGRGILEFVSIERKDGGGWAIPGGMVDAGEKVSATLKREFMEEAMDATNLGLDQAENARLVEEFFAAGQTVYQGYVDDPRNTDNAWMETVAVNFHDPSGESVGRMQLKAGDDARNLKWQAIDHTLELYASHKDFIQKTADLLSAHW